MADWRTELQLILTALADDATTKVVALLGRLDRLDRAEALAFVTEAFPSLIGPYLTAGGDIGATAYEDLPGGVQGFVPVVAELPSNDQLGINIRWLLLNGSPDAVRGTVTRLVNNAVRDTQFANLAAEYGDPVILSEPNTALGTMWARHASANACGFCRMLATRKAVYRSKESAERVTGRGIDLTQTDHRNIAMGLMTRDEALARRSVYRSTGQAARLGKQVGDKRKSGRTRGLQKLGDKFHDHCRCLAVPVRPGASYEPAPYVEQWEKDYQAASKAIPDGTDSRDVPRLISNHMDNASGGGGPQRREESSKRRRQRSETGAVTKAGGGGPRDPGGPGGKGPGSGGIGPQGPDPKWLKASRAHVAGLTGRHRQSVVDYTSTGHKRINQWLRRGQMPVDPSVAAKVKDIDAVLAKNPLSDVAALTRTIDMQETFKITRGEDLVKIAGKERIERGFMSTTRISAGGKTKDYAKPVRLSVVAPKGTPAAAIEDISKYAGQGEVLLGRGLKYIVVDPVYDGSLGMWRATMYIKEGGTP